MNFHKTYNEYTAILTRDAVIQLLRMNEVGAKIPLEQDFAPECGIFYRASRRRFKIYHRLHKELLVFHIVRDSFLITHEVYELMADLQKYVEQVRTMPEIDLYHDDWEVVWEHSLTCSGVAAKVTFQSNVAARVIVTGVVNIDMTSEHVDDFFIGAKELEMFSSIIRKAEAKYM